MKDTRNTSARGRVAGRAATIAAVLAAIAVMTVLLSALAFRVLGAFSSPAQAPAAVGASTRVRATPPPSAAPTSAPAATPASQAGGDWQPYVNADVGFRLDVPAVLGSSHGFFINNFTGQGFDMTYTGAPTTTPLQTLEAETTVEVLYSGTITDRDICPHDGTPVMLGDGIVGLQETNAPPDANGPDAPYPYVHVSLVLNGTAIRIELRGQAPAETFFTRYGDLWQHMLASFATVPGAPVSPTHPCG
jgi:hypothetical protein